MAEPTKMAQKMAERRDKEIMYNAEQLAHAFTKSLSQAHFQGKCKCGLMLMATDRTKGKNSFCCPRCGRTGEAAPVK